jgi:hypothetical protein
MLSADVLMAEKGVQTGINWKSTHDNILVYLLTGLTERRCGIVELFRAWDDVLFPDAEEPSMGAARGTEPAAGVGCRKMLAVLREMDVVQEELEADVEQ